MDLEEIRRHWQKAGEDMSLSEKITSTSRDPFLGQLEEKYIQEHLNANQHIAEVGCGDAIHTLEYSKKVKSITGVDIARSLIKKAKKRVSLEACENVKFVVGSVLELEKVIDDKPVDCVISQRCLINLPSWKYQKKAIQQIYKVLKPNGLFLMTEGFQDELDNINCLREQFGLSTIKVVKYNRNLEHREFDEFICRYFNIEVMRHYGVYIVFSRVYHPLVVLPDEPKHDSRLNEVAYMLSNQIDIPNFKRYSYNLFYALRKK